MRKIKYWSILTICALAGAAPILAIAQQQSAPPPPRLEKLEEGSDPGITIRKPEGEKKITEKREQGKVTEIKVQSGKSAYVLKPNEPAGSAVPGDAESSGNRAAQFQVLEFGAPKTGKEAAPPETLAPAGKNPAAAK